MARNAGVGIERHLAEIAAVVRTTDPDAVHANHGFTGRGHGRLRNIQEHELLRLIEADGFHLLIVFLQALEVAAVMDRGEYRQDLGQQGAVDRLGGPLRPVPDVHRIGAAGNRRGDVRMLD